MSSTSGTIPRDWREPARRLVVRHGQLQLALVRKVEEHLDGSLPERRASEHHGPVAVLQRPDKDLRGGCRIRGDQDRERPVLRRLSRRAPGLPQFALLAPLAHDRHDGTGGNEQACGLDRLGEQAARVAAQVEDPRGGAALLEIVDRLLDFAGRPLAERQDADHADAAVEQARLDGRDLDRSANHEDLAEGRRVALERDPHLRVRLAEDAVDHVVDRLTLRRLAVDGDDAVARGDPGPGGRSALEDRPDARWRLVEVDHDAPR